MEEGASIRLGLALGGGVGRGLAHLGVLEVLEEHALAPQAIAGTSIGALMGALWLTSGSAEEAIDKLVLVHRLREVVALLGFTRSRSELAG